MHWKLLEERQERMRTPEFYAARRRKQEEQGGQRRRSRNHNKKTFCPQWHEGRLQFTNQRREWVSAGCALVVAKITDILHLGWSQKIGLEYSQKAPKIGKRS
mmetsp:Transcript_34954/g.52600  ORF Transcript_34954/g.52600 Transcript_34954/m.52600 type:complete len:102 (+) Transcript_34954:668-973(+)